MNSVIEASLPSMVHDDIPLEIVLTANFNLGDFILFDNILFIDSFKFDNPNPWIFIPAIWSVDRIP